MHLDKSNKITQKPLRHQSSEEFPPSLKLALFPEKIKMESCLIASCSFESSGHLSFCSFCFEETLVVWLHG